MPNSSNSSKKFGNTKQISCSKRWSFTICNYTQSDIDQLEKIGSSNKYVYGLEIAPSTGMPHIQGYIEFNVKCRPKSLFTNQSIHWEKSKGSRNQNIAYCTKEGNAYGNLLEDKVIVSQPYGWQLEVTELIKKKPDPRKIYWYWEFKGGAGKSSLAKYLCVEHGAIILSGKVADMKHGIASYHLKHAKYPQIIIIDIPRSIDVDYLSYTGIEEIKNGCFFCPKYESDMIVMNPPHIIIFSNEEPNTEKMSIDRWEIKKII